jgi:serine/threonine-protein kinase
MLTGFLPEDGIKNPGECHPEADSNWDAFVRKALQKDPDLRFAACDEMLAALDGLGAAWEKKKRDFCRLSPPGNSFAIQAEKQTAKKLRSTALKASPKEAGPVFGCDRLMRPVAYSDAASSIWVQGEVAFDLLNGLVWQRSGSEDPLDRAAARAYVESLRLEAFAGISGWRLPTVDELLALLRRPGFGIEDCLPPAFDKKQKALWSSDRATFVSGWYVNMELGFAGSADFTCRFHVRAVACASPQPPGNVCPR